MANWWGGRLVVTGRPRDLLKFSRLARRWPYAVFTNDMRYGEYSELSSERMKKLGRGRSKKVYHFQYCSDGREHFSGISVYFPALSFLLVTFDPGGTPTCQTHFISRGRVRKHDLPNKLVDDVFERNGLTDDSWEGDWSDDDETNYNNASIEIMNLAEAHWEAGIKLARKPGQRRR